MDVSGLTTFLAPFLPYFLDAGRDAAAEGARAFGDKAWEHARRLWSKLGPTIKTNGAAQEAVADVVTRPADARALGALELQIEKLLAADGRLARDVEHLWNQAGQDVVVATGTGNVAIRGDLTEAIITTGDQNHVTRSP